MWSPNSQEAKRKLLRIGNTKLASVLIGMSKEGVVRADYKTKEVCKHTHTHIHMHGVEVARFAFVFRTQNSYIHD